MRLFRFSWERGLSSSSGGDAGGFAVIAVLTSEMMAPQPGQVAFVGLMPSGILSFFPQDLQIGTVGMVTPPPFNLMRESPPHYRVVLSLGRSVLEKMLRGSSSTPSGCLWRVGRLS